jgi:branched-chain amino acid transport system substrate-binding protein
VDGADLADSFELVARSAGLNVVGVQAFEPGTVNYAPFAASVAQSGADCVMISAITDSGAAAVTRQLAAAMPKARLFGTAGVAQTAFVDPAEGGLPFGLDPRILITSPSLPEQADPAERGFDLAYTRQFGSPPPSAAFGYEAMSLLLNAISRATGRGNHSARRSKVNSELFATHDRHSILGTYSIDSSGDISLRRYGVYRVLDGTLRYWGAIRG